jgi:hypothetical protein
MWAQCTLFKSPLTRINSPRNATSPRALVSHYDQLWRQQEAVAERENREPARPIRHAGRLRVA